MSLALRLSRISHSFDELIASAPTEAEASRLRVLKLARLHDVVEAEAEAAVEAGAVAPAPDAMAVVDAPASPIKPASPRVLSPRSSRGKRALLHFLALNAFVDVSMPGLRPSSVVLWLYLLRHANWGRRGLVSASYRRMADATGLTHVTISSALRELIERGLLVREVTGTLGGRRASRYRIVVPRGGAAGGDGGGDDAGGDVVAGGV